MNWHFRSCSGEEDLRWMKDEAWFLLEEASLKFLSVEWENDLTPAASSVHRLSWNLVFWIMSVWGTILRWRFFDRKWTTLISRKGHRTVEAKRRQISLSFKLESCSSFKGEQLRNIKFFCSCSGFRIGSSKSVRISIICEYWRLFEKW